MTEIEGARAPGPRAALSLPWIAGALAFGAFLALVPRAAAVGDAAELTLALALGGVPHPTGYPLYVLLGHPFVRAFHALGASWVVAAAAWSALGAGVAAGFMVALARRLVAARAGRAPLPAGLTPASATTIAALAPATAIALHPVWVSASTQAEVYSWWFAWLAAAAWTAHGIVGRLESPAPAARTASRDAALWGLVCGLGLAHHLLAGLHVAALTLALVTVAVRAGRWRWSLVAWSALGAAPALASYAFLPWRALHPAAFQWPITPGFPGMLEHVRGSVYAAHYVGRGFSPDAWNSRLLGETVMPVLLTGMPVAALAAWRLRGFGVRSWALALVGAAIAILGFVWRYGVPDPLMYFVPALMVAAMLAAPLVAALLGRVRPAVAIAALAALVVTGVSASGVRVVAERRRASNADMTARIAWASLPPGPAIVLWKDDHWARLRCYQLLEGSRTDLEVVNPNGLTYGPNRARFAARWGVDPVAAAGDVVDSIGPALRARLDVPVHDFPQFIERTRSRRSFAARVPG